MLYLRQLTSLVLLALINGEVGADCPPERNDLKLIPSRLLVEYGKPARASCHSMSNYTDLGWKVSLGSALGPNDQRDTWKTNSLTDWEMQPVCYMILDDNEECSKTLQLTIYKLPDQVSISMVNHTGKVTEGRDYELQCDIQGVAPVQLITVNWYKGAYIVNAKNLTHSDGNFTGHPLNISITHKITASLDDDKIQYRCEAKLNLSPEELKNTTVTSDPLNVTTQCYDLELDPPEAVIPYGDPLSVSCRSRSNYTDLGWRVPQGNTISHDQTITWKTDNWTEWEIQPVCYRAPDDGQCSRAVPLIVYRFPDQAYMSIANHAGPMIAGKKYDLQCDVQNFAPVSVLSVSWYKGDTLLRTRGFNDLPTKTPSNKTVAFKIIASSNDTEAQFRCEARLKLGSGGPQPPPVVKSNVIEVAVHHKPVIRCTRWSPMINTSLDACPYEVTGNPSPKIAWKRDNLPVSSNALLRRDDSGRYEIVASNVVGKDSCIVNIVVEYAPTFECPANYTAREHESFLGKCSVMASPKANITWEKDGKTVNPPQHLTRRDSGSYVITAVNEHGTKRHILAINVEYGPEIEPDVQQIKVKEGEDVSLNCTAEGNPEPEVMWSFQNQTKATERRQTPLIIPKAMLADGGVYTCTATNDLGSVTRTVSLTVENYCPIRLQPEQLVVEFGASASAICSTTSNHQGLGWEASQGAVAMMEDVHVITWSVDTLTHWDIRPICYINVHKQCELELPVTVYKRPDRVSISTASHTGPMIEGRQYELQCDVQNVAPVHLLTVNWYKGQQLVETESFSYKSVVPVNNVTTLQISPSKDDDGVQYRCETQLELGPEGPQPPPIVTSDPLNITVDYKPVINCLDWSPPVNTPLKSYPYHIAGNPSPNIIWYRDNLSVSSDTPLRRDDSGRYEIVASNVVGKDSCIVNIVVEYAPTFECPANYTAREHESFLGKCSVMASPKANITWEKDGKTVIPPQHLTRRDSGSYVITAVNEHGTKKHVLTINVQYGPEINIRDSVEVYVGKDVILQCTAEGNPEPEVVWSFHNQIKNTRGQQMLHITEVKSADAGEYTCNATNDLGSKIKTVTLSVIESNLRTILITCGILLALILISAYIIYICVRDRRSGQYNVQANGAVGMSLLKSNEGTET